MANFQILEPLQDDAGDVDSISKVLVRINDPNGSRFQIKVYQFDDTAGEGAETGTETVNNTTNPGTQFSVRVPAGTVAASSANNRMVYVRDQSEGVSDGHPFRAVPFSGSGSVDERLPEQILYKVCRTDEPIPTMLTLKLDGTLTEGSCTNTGELNRPVPLQFSRVEPFVGRWLSKPIALGEKKPGPPAFWVLEKKNARTWTLTLRQQNKKIAAYVCKTEEAKDCSFPIQLKLKGAKGKHFKKWPKLAKIKPAKGAQ